MKDLLENNLTESYLTALFKEIEQDNALFLSRDVILSIQNNLPESFPATWQGFTEYYRYRLEYLLQRREYLLHALSEY